MLGPAEEAPRCGLAGPPLLVRRSPVCPLGRLPSSCPGALGLERCSLQMRAGPSPMVPVCPSVAPPKIAGCQRGPRIGRRASAALACAPWVLAVCAPPARVTGTGRAAEPGLEVAASGAGSRRAPGGRLLATLGPATGSALRPASPRASALPASSRRLHWAHMQREGALSAGLRTTPPRSPRSQRSTGPSERRCGGALCKQGHLDVAGSLACDCCTGCSGHVKVLANAETEGLRREQIDR